MHCIRYRITAFSPLIISSKAGDMNMVTTEKYIPGTSVIGILANRFMKKRNISTKHAHEKDEFFNWFLSGKLKISNAYIFSEDENNKEFAYLPVPFSIQNKKGETDIYDLLYVDDDFEEQTKPINKFCVLKEGRLQTKKVETSLNFHHARDRDTGTSEESKIFNYESLCPNQIFQGDISGTETDLKALLHSFDKRWTAYAGRSKNAQYGKIRFEIIDETPQPCHMEIEWDDEISLTFLSDTIIYNKNGFSTVDTNVLQNYLGKDVTIKKAFVKKGDIETFVGVWRLRKPSESCFLAGSAFLLDISRCDKTKLAELQENGIGERTHEGFGKCLFGWQTEEEINETKEDSPEIKEPPFPMPDETKEILKTLVRAAIKKQIEWMALHDQKDFKRLPSNSLIGRLAAISKVNNKQQDFKESIEKLKRSARNNLERCNNGKKSLFEFLVESDINAESILKESKNSNLETICNEIHYKPEKDKTLENLYQIYFETFFSSMRKREKSDKGDG